jgi:hypothetical protein
MMTRQEALNLARKRWGKRAFTTFHEEAVVGEERASMRDEQRVLREKMESLPRGSAERDEARREWTKLRDILLTHRCGVGYSYDGYLGVMRTIHGSGDTWEEACANARIT